MDDILFIDGCLRGEHDSRTRALCDAFLEKMREENNLLRVDRVDLAQLNLMPLTHADVLEKEQLAQSHQWDHPIFEQARRFAQADVIVVGAPYWDLSFPAAVKVYAERVCVRGITFCYQNNAVEGLCKAKRFVYVSTAGGPIGDFNFGGQYWESLCRCFFGICRVDHLLAEGLDIWGADVEGILSDATVRAHRLASDIRV